MHAGRVALILTGLIVAILAIVFAVLRWETANRLATIASALAAMAAVGVAIWAALRGNGRSIRVSDTGSATASGGTANTGLRGRPPVEETSVRVENTGDASASGGGDANTGVTDRG